MRYADFSARLLLFQVLGVILAITFLAIYPALAVAQTDDSSRRVLNRDANIRQGPGMEYPIIMPALQGAEMIVKTVEGEWARVEIPSTGAQGWVYTSLVSAAEKKIKTIEPSRVKKSIESNNETEVTDSVNSEKIPEPDNADALPLSDTPVKLGVIDVQAVIEKSRKGMAIVSRYQNHPADKSAEYFLSEENEAVKDLRREIMTIVDNYASQHGFTHIVNKNAGGTVFSQDRYDITDDIITIYDAQFEKSKN